MAETGWPFKADCVRSGCGHSSSVHGFDDSDLSLNGIGPGDPRARFRCQVCGTERCPDMVRSVENLQALEAESRG